MPSEQGKSPGHLREDLILTAWKSPPTDRGGPCCSPPTLQSLLGVVGTGCCPVTPGQVWRSHWAAYGSSASQDGPGLGPCKDGVGLVRQGAGPGRLLPAVCLARGCSRVRAWPLGLQRGAV